MIRLNFPIISISFHASGDYLAIASGTTLEVWKWKVSCNYEDFLMESRHQISHNMPVVMSSNAVEGMHTSRQYMLRAITHGRNIRALVFHPIGDYLLVAAPETPRLPSDVLTYCR